MSKFFRNIVYLIKRFNQYDPFIFFYGFIMVILGLLISFLGLRLTQEVINLVIAQSSINQLIQTLLIFFSLILIFRLLNNWLIIKSSTSRAIFRSQMINEIVLENTRIDYQILDREEFEKAQEKAILTAANDDSLMQIFPENIKQFFEEFLKIVLYGSLLTVINPLFLGLIAILVVLIILYRFFQQKVINNHREERARLSAQTEYIQRASSNFSLAKDVRLFNVEPWFKNLFDDVVKKQYHIIFKTGGVVLGGQLLSGLLILTLTGFGYYVLINQLYNQSINIGELTFFIGAITTIALSSSSLVNVFFDLRENSEDINHFRNFFEIEKIFNHNSTLELPEVIESIEFKNVTYSYPQTDTPLFENFNITFNQNEKIALVGLNGAGKTTLIKLLCNLYKPDAGQILINGIDNQKYNVKDYYNLFSIVFQDLYDLPMNIRESIVQGSDFNQEKYNEVIDQAGLHKLINNLSLKDKTTLVREVDPNATTLSGGQRQKLKLAQALYKDGPILILDEPTAPLDPLAESEVYQQYHKHSKNKLSIFVSHRLASTQFCDRILYLENGKILEDGTHRELMNQQGQYYEMYEKQAYYYQKGELQ